MRLGKQPKRIHRGNCVYPPSPLPPSRWQTQLRFDERYTQTMRRSLSDRSKQDGALRNDWTPTSIRVRECVDYDELNIHTAALISCISIYFEGVRTSMFGAPRTESSYKRLRARGTCAGWRRFHGAASAFKARRINFAWSVSSAISRNSSLAPTRTNAPPVTENSTGIDGRGRFRCAAQQFVDRPQIVHSLVHWYTESCGEAVPFARVREGNLARAAQQSSHRNSFMLSFMRRSGSASRACAVTYHPGRRRIQSSRPRPSRRQAEGGTPGGEPYDPPTREGK